MFGTGCTVKVGRARALTVEPREPVELRKLNRYRQILALTLEWTDENGNATFAEGLTQDICAGGMYVHINPCPLERTLVQYDVFLPAVYRSGPNVRIAGTGKIVRVERLGGAGRWHGAAVRFSKHMVQVMKLRT